MAKVRALIRDADIFNKHETNRILNDVNENFDFKGFSAKMQDLKNKQQSLMELGKLNATKSIKALPTSNRK